MPAEKFANNAGTTLSAAVTSPTATTVSVASASGFPSAAQYRVRIDDELLLVTAGAGTTTWTVTRGAEGTTAATHASGAAVTHVLTAGGLEQGRLDFTPLSLCEGRLTLQSGTPVPTTDQTAKTSVYFAPFLGNRVALYDGAAWKVLAFAEVSVAVPNTTNTPFDVFAHDNNGSVALETVNWTNDTTRATALATQDGVYVKSGAATRRYLGTGRTTGTSGQCEDSQAKRFLWNLAHRVPRPMQATDSTDLWTYTTAAWRAANGSTANRVEFVLGLALGPVEATARANAYNSTDNVDVATGIGLDSTTANAAVLVGGTVMSTHMHGIHAHYQGQPAAGYHFLQWLEYSPATGTTTWSGDAGLTYWQAGLFGRVHA